MAPTDGLDPDQLMRNADLALYRAKDEGRNTYRFFEREMDARMQARISLEQDMRKALTNNEFELHYQPIVNIESGDITCFEALIRWNHPQRGMISPGEFIPLAEESGFIVALGEWALRSACATAATWPGSQRVAVNLSALQFQKPGLIQIVVGALAASGLPARRLELEITESVLMEDSEATIATLHQFRELGLRISMDDFGTGYSSLRYLQSFPFDKIKIDRAFIQDVTENHGTLSIVRAVTTLARSLGMATTAEGIETQEQLDLIRAEGCTEMQGYFFSAPQKAGDVQRLFFAKDGLRIYMPDPSAKSVSSAA
jgi:predicted signal transduction protein with EAL and GGDEF domain